MVVGSFRLSVRQKWLYLHSGILIGNTVLIGTLATTILAQLRVTRLILSVVSRMVEDQPLAVEGPVKIVDTTDFDSFSAKEVVQWVRASMALKDI
jgi:hypothetical protein